MKTVSVILTTYNSQNTVDRALRSVFQQKGIGKAFNLEVIVIDDCSTDSTVDKLKKYEVTLLTTDKNSGGPNKGRNLGLEKATGDFICIMDHDDEWLPEKIKSQLGLADLAPVISCGYRIKGKEADHSILRINKTSDAGSSIIYRKNDTFLKKLSKAKNAQITYIGGLLYSSDLKDIFFEEQFGMLDFDWLLKLFQHRNSAEVCKPLFIRHIDNMNLSLNEVYRKNDYNFSNRILNDYEDQYPREVKMARKRLNGSLARYYYYTEKMKYARSYFLNSGVNIKNVLYFLTSYAGYKFVNKHFRVFG